MLAQRSGKSDLTLLLTSAGRRVELLRCFRAAAQALDIRLEIIACDLRPERSAACHDADKMIRVPSCTDGAAYGEAVLDICRTHGVSLVVPTIDPELLPLARLHKHFAELETELAVGSPELVEIARDKLKTAEFLSVHGLPAPRTTAAERIEQAASWDWPLLAKPRHGSSGRLVQAVNNAAEVAALPPEEPFVVQELLRAPEYTVNMYFDRAGTLRCAVPHERLQVRAGEVEKGITRRSPELLDIALRLAGVLPGPRGALCFQAMADTKGALNVFEINARFGGGYPLADRAGAVFARWLLEECLGRPSSADDNWSEGVMMLRYDAALFLTP